MTNNLKKVIMKSGGAKSLGWRKSEERGHGSRTTSESMDVGTSEQSPGLSYQQTQAGEDGSSGPR